MSKVVSRVVSCNGAKIPKNVGSSPKPLVLNYLDGASANIKVSLPSFVRGLYHLPDRILDLLEIASYVFTADRLTHRGSKAAVEYHKWSRCFHFFVKVRDLEFWDSRITKQKLADALCFMSGDREYRFTFQPGHSTPPTSLFDSSDFKLDGGTHPEVILFSGGLDSLAGIIQMLEETGSQLFLVSHRSQPGVTRTQDQLFKALNELYPTRVHHYKFFCSLKGVKAVEETQRTRAFLYNSIAYALAHALSAGRVLVFENGITAINFSRRQDLINARASRTTHPKTLSLLSDFFYDIEGSEIELISPFLWKTKADILSVLLNYDKQHLLSSTVSCSKTFQNLSQSTHCGGCFQCVDRRFGAYGSKLNDYDGTAIYKFDFIRESINDGETRTILTDYVRLARDFATSNIDHFYSSRLSELGNIVDYIDEPDEQAAVESLYRLCQRHGRQVAEAMQRMRENNDHPYEAISSDSFLDMLSRREYLREPIERLSSTLSKRLKTSLPVAFQRNLPINENDLNDKISAILRSESYEIQREYPLFSFALAGSRPDHSVNCADLLIESKYIRGKTSPSKVTEGIAADLIKYSDRSHILFVIYDPHRAIVDDERFAADFEKKGRCSVLLVR